MAIDWTSMSETGAPTCRRIRTVSAPNERQGVRNALLVAFQNGAADLPEEFRRLLSRLG